MSSETQRPVPPSVSVETLNSFTASIVHKVSNPLSIIIGHAQFLLLQFEEERADERNENKELINTVETILKESTRLASLMSQLLGLSSKLTAGGQCEADAVREIERFVDETPATRPDDPAPE